MNTETKKKLAPVLGWEAARDIPCTPVESSQIHSIGWDEASATLAVRFRDFKTNGPKSLYHYLNVGATDFAAFKDAESKSVHFRDFIKPFPDRYPCFRVDETGKPEAEA